MFNLMMIASLMMMMGTMITLSSSSWMTAWMGMELNLLGFIPMIFNKNNPLSSEASMKYFLIQAISSSLFLLGISWSSFSISYNFMLTQNLTTIIMYTALLTKVAAAPFHFWMFPMVESMKWSTFFLFMTWQKLAPLSLLSMTKYSLINLLIIFINGMIGSFMMLQQTSTKKLLAFSSISHMAWILAANLISNSMMMIYFMFYILSTSAITLLMYNHNLLYLSQISFLNNTTKIPLILNMLSLGGFPPLLGFFPKLSLISMMLNLNISFSIMMIMLMMFSLISMYSYIHSFILPLLMNLSTLKILMLNKSNHLMSMLTLIPILPLVFLPLIPLL